MKPIAPLLVLLAWIPAASALSSAAAPAAAGALLLRTDQPCPVLMEIPEGPAPHIGLGQCLRGRLDCTEAGIESVALAIDLRHITFKEGPGLNRWLLDAWETPILIVRARGNQDGAIAELIWRGRRIETPATLDLRESSLAAGALSCELRFALSPGAFGLPLTGTVEGDGTPAWPVRIRCLFSPTPMLADDEELAALRKALAWEWEAAGRPPADVLYLLRAVARTEGRAIALLHRAGADPTALCRSAEAVLLRTAPVVARFELSPEARALLEHESRVVAEAMGADRTGVEHLLLALMEQGDDRVRAVLADSAALPAAYRWAVRESATPPLRTEQIEILGNPSAARYQGPARAYARNVWDLQTFDNRLFIGSGNSSNLGPAPNAGPADVWAWNPMFARFEKEFVTDEEQISHFVPAGDRLLIGGHDPREPWELGNLYIRDAGRWRKLRTIPRGIHCYDVTQRDGRLLAALGTPGGGAVAVSEDDGQSWTLHPLKNTGRAFALLDIAGELYASCFNDKLFVLREGAFQAVSTDLFPDSTHSETPLALRATEFGGATVYLGVDNTNDHQWTPFGLFVARAIDDIRRLNLPDSTAPCDLLVRNGHVWALSNEGPFLKHDDLLHVVTVWRSADLTDWHPAARLRSAAPARSMELLGGDLYLGLGCDTADLRPEAGQILRIRREHLRLESK